MKNYTTLSFQSVLSSSMSGPKISPQGIFWDAFLKLKDGNRKEAADTLRSEYFDNNNRKPSNRAKLIYVLAHTMPFSSDDLGWVEILASANLTIRLGHLCREGRIEAIHAIHAEVEMNPRHQPNPLLSATDEDFQCLRELYAIEENQILLYHAHDKRIAHWLRRRQKALYNYQKQIQ